MRFSLSADHCDFFHKNNYIELEGVIPLNQIATLKKKSDELLAKRLNTTPAQLESTSNTKRFQSGFDLWRESSDFRKITHKQSLAKLASELFQIPLIRYGFDQYFSITNKTPSPFLKTATLQETSCLSPLAGGLILPLEDLLSPLPSFPMPIHRGNVLFVSSSLPIPWKEIYLSEELYFVLIGFAVDKTRFCPDTSDPHAVELKKLGYVFNDFLNDSLHPVLTRRR